MFLSSECLAGSTDGAGLLCGVFKQSCHSHLLDFKLHLAAFAVYHCSVLLAAVLFACSNIMYSRAVVRTAC